MASALSAICVPASAEAKDDALSGEGVPVACPVSATVLQASFRNLGQNSALHKLVDSATCGPELKQSLGLKSVCKTGFRSALGGRVLSQGRVLSAPTL